MVTDNREKRLSKLKNHLTERNHPPEKIYYKFTKCFQLKLNKKKKDLEKNNFHKDISSSPCY